MFYGVISVGEGKLNLLQIDAETQEQTCEIIVGDMFKSTKDFVKCIPFMFRKNVYAAVIIRVFEWECSEFPNNVEFCKAIREQMDVAGIPYHFISLEFFYSCYFLAGNISLNHGERIIVVLMPSNKIFNVNEFKFTKNGYIHCGKCFNNETNDKNIQEKIIDRQSDIILVVKDGPPNNLLLKKLRRKHFKSKLVEIAIFDVISNYTNKGFAELAKWVLDNTNVKYAVLPLCARKYNIMVKADEGDDDPILFAADGSQLPFKKSCVVPKSDVKYTLTTNDDYTGKLAIVEQFSLPQNCPQYSITLSIDTENFPKCEIQPYLIKEILNLPSILNETMKSKIPVIAFWDNASVICIFKDEENGYQFLDTWNGAFGQELYISFDAEKPKYNQNAAAILASKPASVVFDLLQILSFSSSEDAKPDKSWKFEITKDETNPILIEVENFDGTLKLGTPAFIMALLIKEHLRVIKTEIGEKPAELGIAIFDNSGKFSSDEMKRIKDGIEEACKLLKIKFSFV